MLEEERRMTGFEPAHSGATTHCLNHLATLAYAYIQNYTKVNFRFQEEISSEYLRSD